jgi:hypothetical protein
VHQHPGLAAAGTGQHHQMAGIVGDSGALRRVEAVEDRRGRHRTGF